MPPDPEDFEQRLRQALRSLPVPEYEPSPSPLGTGPEDPGRRLFFFRPWQWLLGSALAGGTGAAVLEVAARLETPPLMEAAFRHVSGEEGLRGQLMAKPEAAAQALGFDPTRLTTAIWQLAKDCHVATLPVWHWSYFMEKVADGQMPGWAWMLVFKNPTPLPPSGQAGQRHWRSLHGKDGYPILLLSHSEEALRLLTQAVRRQGVV
ncbi:hypothetical protein [Acidithiobacillus caldus]|jgi:hypothetical protein|uniref:Uncharacterized protein n=1 Tax=Acidithiobacillus caldus (strain ATCC 51756 / DSM 8584 / KU) TaxID=637389 RepID=A0A059ZWD1_ACICK|nr:hypothetical protein [Acidithiobacillus caldus]AIA54212.1 hypothetical protein Acaty_c0322 [Acidithiobacillus caldus ATCC 51756]MBU2728864.1 hypothetical protein [Acidithiobacillus caldus]MBU2736916.1 hypothetical protein [Acidithiobacillus caldus ATCC 51756]MBU2746391.1 hypothetical protein [Acidithiobacillus caldus]MBU2780356.1 hypothetical protein [Acidithiobacillus caldus]